MILLHTMAISIRVLFILTFITGILYPIVITGFAERFFPFQSNGSLAIAEGKTTGSELIAQKFTKNEYFWPRPSETDYYTIPSGASNQSATNASLRDKIEERKRNLLEKHPDQKSVPNDLLFASGSGLDPHISPDAARFQMNRIIKARKLNGDRIRLFRDVVERSIERPSFGYIGENRINVLRLNLKLDSEFGKILK
ncbi:potassium-transporting ATPase subunit KdpC [Leptospira santarosai]|uniref:potassium-transporting ATPase subunit KdpC n=1 Tax=Leptospira santarosai TaxID=28183 RepID=UPI0024AFF95B|nr:potassium-transporting ATPase subunit KdpC [Leptospira santarosai]MDI7186616.1 potassium-transporting ATPase subunit KdpC [Leptospira santarosai]MDI7200080.1 potassium-transporting ATPase subunit KdpC [Leptospira santarosai]MDI7206173.1 potassium-transporting ATPase subunit KdpC [Leptospira santarosai]